MGDAIYYCEGCGTQQMCHMERRCLRRAKGPSDAAACSRCADHWKLLKIFTDIDGIMQTMRPRYVQTPSMDGRYPCWIVWLPKEGTTERKTLKDALVDFADQAAAIHSENRPR